MDTLYVITDIPLVITTVFNGCNYGLYKDGTLECTIPTPVPTTPIRLPAHNQMAHSIETPIRSTP